MSCAGHALIWVYGFTEHVRCLLQVRPSPSDVLHMQVSAPAEFCLGSGELGPVSDFRMTIRSRRWQTFIKHHDITRNDAIYMEVAAWKHAMPITVAIFGWQHLWTPPDITCSLNFLAPTRTIRIQTCLKKPITLLTPISSEQSNVHAGPHDYGRQIPKECCTLRIPARPYSRTSSHCKRDLTS